MSHVQNFHASAFQSNQSTRSVAHFLDEDFDQDGLSGRYGNARDRRVPQKLSLNRSRPRRYVSQTTVR